MQQPLHHTNRSGEPRLRHRVGCPTSGEPVSGLGERDRRAGRQGDDKTSFVGSDVQARPRRRRRFQGQERGSP